MNVIHLPGHHKEQPSPMSAAPRGTLTAKRSSSFKRSANLKYAFIKRLLSNKRAKRAGSVGRPIDYAVIDLELPAAGIHSSSANPPGRTIGDGGFGTRDKFWFQLECNF
jgi:hypothetical protein